MIRFAFAVAVIFSAVTSVEAQQKLPADHWLNGGPLLTPGDAMSAYKGLLNVLKAEAAQKSARENFTKDAYYWVRIEKFDGTVGDWKMSQFDGDQFHVPADGTRYNFAVVNAWKGPIEVPNAATKIPPATVVEFVEGADGIKRLPSANAKRQSWKPKKPLPDGDQSAEAIADREANAVNQERADRLAAEELRRFEDSQQHWKAAYDREQARKAKQPQHDLGGFPHFHYVMGVRLTSSQYYSLRVKSNKAGKTTHVMLQEMLDTILQRELNP